MVSELLSVNQGEGLSKEVITFLWGRRLACPGPGGQDVHPTRGLQKMPGFLELAFANRRLKPPLQFKPCQSFGMLRERRFLSKNIR
jgi:hypothetical protein